MDDVMPAQPPPDVTGWPLEEAERMLSEAGVRWDVRWTAWTDRLPSAAGERPAGGAWVLAHRTLGARDALLVAARFAYDARGAAGGGAIAVDHRPRTREGG